MTETDWDELDALPLKSWTPQSQLSVPVTSVPRSAVPSVDIHNHLGRWLNDGEWMYEDVSRLIAVMDESNVQTVVNLDGMWGDELSENIERYDAAYPGRFATFCQLDWVRLAEPDGADQLIASLDDSKRRGARGVKVWKNLGLSVRDSDGALILPDDPRVIRVLEHAGRLGLPVLIHVADPKAFFAPLDENNERLDELRGQRDWWFGDTDVYPTFDRLVDGLASLVVATPGTTYIGAHVGCVGEDLDWVERLFELAPNFHVDIGGRMAEIGRQPRRFAALVRRYPKRVLFGTDIYPVSAEAYALYFRFLETEDEAFEYAPDEPIPPQGRWAVSALGLDASALAAIYADNARRILASSEPAAR
jgi:predicted TIM-barrel fold metal-dependent hydrolase